MCNLSKAICLCMSSTCYWMLWTHSDYTLKAMKCMPVSFQSVLRNENFAKIMSLWQSIGSFFCWVIDAPRKLQSSWEAGLLHSSLSGCNTMLPQRQCTVWHLKRWLQKRLWRSHSLQYTILLCLATSACIQNLTDPV